MVHRVEDAWAFRGVILVPMPGGIAGKAGPGGKGGPKGARTDKQCTAAYQIVAVIMVFCVLAMVFVHWREILPSVLVYCELSKK